MPVQDDYTTPTSLNLSLAWIKQALNYSQDKHKTRKWKAPGGWGEGENETKED